MKKMTAKQLDREIARLYRHHAEGLQILILDIPKLFAEARRAYSDGGDLEAAVKAAINTYCARAL